MRLKFFCIVTIAALLGACSKDVSKVDLPATPSAQPAAATPAAQPRPQVDNARRINGTVEARRTAAIPASVSGSIRAVYVVEGQSVAEGEKLVEIDARAFQLRIEQAQAAIAVAQSQITTLKIEYDRAQRLLEKSAIAPSQVDQIKGQVDAANAQLQAMNVNLKMARKERDDAVIRAPFAGVVTSMAVTVGEYASAGPTALLTLVDNDVIVRLHAPEEFVGRFSPGQTLRANIPSQNRVVVLKIEGVNPVLSTRSRAFDIIAAPADPDAQLRPGMFAEVELEADAASTTTAGSAANTAANTAEKTEKAEVAHEDR